MQNLVSLNLTAQDLADLDGALETMRRVFAPLVTLQADQVRGLAKMGEKSEVFCRQTLQVLAANPQIVPPSLGLAEAQADLVALDALRPRLLQLRQLVEKAGDTEIALGADVMATALEGYALLKMSGKDEGLKAVRRDLGSRWSRSAPASPAAPAPGG
jgi:hypothetical protein